MAYIYPKTIQTTTGRSAKYATQAITNPKNLCSDNTKLAYWGVKTPLFVGIYIRNYPDSITTISGSYYDPETIYATDWNVGNIPNNAIVKKIKIQYKWEQISYSCSSADCYGRFDRPTISIISHGKTLSSFSGAKPEAIRYHNNKTNKSKMNTNDAELKTLHSHEINVSKYNMTIKDLKSMKIKFNPAKNTYHNHCRIVMQFIRIAIDYEEIKKEVQPTFRVYSSITPSKTNTGEEWTYTCRIKTSNNVTKPTKCSITLNDKNTQLKNIQQSVSGNTFTNGVWDIKNFSKGEAKITLKCVTPNPKTVTVTSTIQQYADSVNKQAKSSITIVESIVNLTWNLKIIGDSTPYIYTDSAGSGIRKCIELHMTRGKVVNGNEHFIIDTNNWITDENYELIITEHDNNDESISSTYIENGKWKIDNIQSTKLKARFQEKNTENCVLIKPGDYKIITRHHEDGKNDTEQIMNISVIGPAMDKEFFKLRLEDGTDVRYNSLMFTSGDDLTIPITYDITDENEANFKNMNIIGETVKIPTKEAHYTTYTININDDNIDYENVLSNLEIYNEDGENCSDVIIGVDNQMQLYEGEEYKYCIINSLKSSEQKKLKFIVQSDIEQTCYFKLKPFNYDNYESGEWIISKIVFQDIPNIKLSVSTDNNDLNTIDNKETIIQYCLENKSSVVGGHDHYESDYEDNYDDALKFKIKEPSSFKIKNIELPSANNDDKNAPFFNEKTKILTIPHFPAQQMNEATGKLESTQYCLLITYEATQKGIFDFSINTYDEQYTINDDQYKNSAHQKILVDINNNVQIKTKVSNKRPHIDELIDFTINVKNFTKKQNEFTFVIKDIGTYGVDHNKCDYDIVYTNCEYGTFIPSTENNSLGTWILNDIDINAEHELILTLRPKDIGYHTIQTIFNEDSQEFEDIVNVLERNKQISFNVYHAIDPTNNQDCADFADLIEICDDDYITIDDELYYVIDVTNNSRNDIETTTHIYARLPVSFLNNDIILCNDKYDLIIDNNNLIKIDIPLIKKCENIKIYFKVKPSEMGYYKSTFMLTNRNAKIYHKQLNINVDTQIDSRKLEHEINIYNFEKTNKYFRYELDSDNNIFKFFNQGDKSLKMIDSEKYKKSAIETYRGTNLKELVRQIKNNSKYVEPELLRIGSNKLAAKGYELYPDGFIRRFGLLNSDIFHHTGQLPVTSLLSDRAMHWDIDLWETKVWGGDIYDNGVFDIAIDYDKIPKNFNILDIDNPMHNLQAIVDKAKPYGTQALCYYANTIYLNMGINIKPVDIEVNNQIKFPMNLRKYYITKKDTLTNKNILKMANDFDMISTYHRHDNSIVHYFDMFHYNIHPRIEINKTELCQNINEEDELKVKPDLNLTTDIFTTSMNKQYINECLDIVENLYSYNNNINNIDIIKIMEYDGTKNRSTNFSITNNDIYTFEVSKEEKIKIIHDNDIYNIEYNHDKINNFKGIIIKKEDTILFKRNISTDIDLYKIQIQQYQKEYDNNSFKSIMHIWLNTDENIYYHIGYLIFDNTHDNIINLHYNTFNHIQEDEKITFKITDEEKQIIETTDNIIQLEGKNKWKNLNNINNHNKYAIFENNIDIDTECKDSYISVPPLALKYNNIHLSDTDEIIDIALKIQANTNKNNFTNDIKVNMCKNGDYYIPYNNTSSKIYYPSSISNVSEDFSTDITIQQPNITICSKCMKTSLGLFDSCPHCGSYLVSHYDEKKSVTICDNCSWISNGWYDYCPHCLSESVTKTEVDFNKTYCYDCHSVTNDYYSRCPKCFSKNILHMTNDEKTYNISDKNNKNIDITSIKTYTNHINICNIEVPLNLNLDSVQHLEYLQLHIHGNNYNDGKFHYCPECNTANLGHTDKCPNCQATNVINQTFDNTITDVYCTSNGKTYQIGTYKLEKEFDLSFDLIQLTADSLNDSLFLSFYIDNLEQDKSVNTINSLDIDDNSFSILQDNIPLINIDFDNIYYDYKYKNEKEWLGLDNLQHTNHTYLKYQNNNDFQTPKINLYNFNMPNGNFKQMLFTLCGFNKSDAHINAELIITNKNEEVYHTTIENIGIHNFQETIDLTDIIKTYILEDLSVQLLFTNLIQRTDVYITDCFITLNKDKRKNDIEIEKHKQSIERDGNNYLIKNLHNDLWGINKEEPYYLACRHLDPGLVCFIDFGKINAGEYIRLYNTELIITYKSTYGRIITESIPITYNTHNKCLITGKIQQNNAETWGAIKTPYSILNNLESQIFNNDDDKALSSIPLINGIAQAFIASTNNISQIYLNYDGRIGYPSESIILEICDSEYNTIGSTLLSKEILLPLTKGFITIDVDLDNLNIDNQYWIVLKDPNADENNYHHFKYNGELSVGNLMYLNNHNRDSNIVLCFNINTNIDLRLYYELPTSWDFDVNDLDINSNYKLYQTFYRYNSNQNSNVYIDDLAFESGYTIDNNTEEIINENQENNQEEYYDAEDGTFHTITNDVENQ